MANRTGQANITFGFRPSLTDCLVLILILLNGLPGIAWYWLQAIVPFVGEIGIL